MVVTIKVELDYKRYFSSFHSILSKFNIGHLILLSLGLHFFLMATIPDSFVFDEAFYVPAARSTLQGLPTNIEHNPLAKIVVALSLKVFGDWWFAWRMPIVLMGVSSVYVLYLIAKRFMSERKALMSATILSFDVLYFVHSSIFVLDVPSILFGLIGMELYFAKKYKWSALSFGVSFLMKEVGLLFLGVAVTYHLISNFHIKVSRSERLKIKLPYVDMGLRSLSNWKKIVGFTLILFLVSAGGIQLYIQVYRPAVSLGVTVYVSNNVVVDENDTPVTTQTSSRTVTNLDYIDNPLEFIKNQYNYFTGFVLNFSESDKRPAWTWVLPVGTFWNPPHYLSVSVRVGDKSTNTIDWVSAASPFVEVFCFPILAVAIANLVRKKDRNISLLLLCGIGVTYFTWLYLGLRSMPNYTNFNYYILYSIPFFALGVPFFWRSLIKNVKAQRILMTVHLVLVLGFFTYYFPLNLFRVM